MEQKISAIKAVFQAASIDMLPEIISEYEKDERSGVQALIVSARKKLAALAKEKERMEGMKQYEYQYADAGYICGIDEVGRVPLRVLWLPVQ